MITSTLYTKFCGSLINAWGLRFTICLVFKTKMTEMNLGAAVLRYAQ